MNRLRSSIIALLLYVSCALFSHAGGSFDLYDIQSMLDKSKEWPAIASKYDVSPIGGALRFGNQWTHIGGARCGPYEIGAKLKGRKGDETHTIVIETYLTFLKNGKVITKNLEKNADEFTETVTKITVKKNGADEDSAKDTPEGVVRRYFSLVNERKPNEAFACFSTDFQERRTYKSFLATFNDTSEVELLTAKTLDESQGSANVAIRMIVWDRKRNSTTWSGTLVISKGKNGWRINDMSRLTQK